MSGVSSSCVGESIFLKLGGYYNKMLIIFVINSCGVMRFWVWRRVDVYCVFVLVGRRVKVFLFVVENIGVFGVIWVLLVGGVVVWV